MYMQKIAWKLSSALNNLDSLFSNQDTSYLVDAYLCDCEDARIQTLIYILDDNEPLYCCPYCGNSNFYDANSFVNNMIWYAPIEKIFSHDTLISLEPKISSKKNSSLVYEIAIDIPKDLHLVQNKFTYFSKTLFHVVIDKEISPDFHVTFENSELVELYEKKILYHLQKHLSNSPVLVLCKTLHEAAFFYANKHLSEYEFIYWENLDLLPKEKVWTIEEALRYVSTNRKEKTYKKEIYKHYKSSLYNLDRFNKQSLKLDYWYEEKAQTGRYYFRFAHTVSLYINDVNIAKRMLTIDLSTHLLNIKNNLLEEYMLYLCGHYTLKQIEKLFTRYAQDDTFWLKDTLGLFDMLSETLETLPKTHCNPRDIHDAFLAHLHYGAIREKLEKITFFYEQKYLQACCKIENFDVKLPSNGTELYLWGNMLQNCLSGYYDMIEKRQRTIYGFFQGEELLFAVEIADSSVVQASCKYNTPLTKEDKSLVDGWAKRYFAG